MDSSTPMRRNNTDDDARIIEEALASLQLPHMPSICRPTTGAFSAIGTNFRGPQKQDSSDVPTIQILVVSDIDLSSASELAEYALKQKNVFDASRIDLCIALGPFCRDNDLMSYLTGRQQRKRFFARQERYQQQEISSDDTAEESLSSGDTWSSFFRSREDTAALEGLMTAAISQLESIVCRVLYIPGCLDPLTTFLSPMRLTPNSHNVHKQWLPLAPGLGCGGLLYMDSLPTAITDLYSNYRNDKNKPNIGKGRQKRDKMVDGTGNSSGYLDEEQEEDDNDQSFISGDEDLINKFLLQQTQLQNESSKETDSNHTYVSTLNRLLNLAPANHTHKSPGKISFSASRAQSILITHFVDPGSRNSVNELSGTRQDDNSPLSDSGDGSVLHNENYGMPWPKESERYFEYFESTVAKELFCLEIASGSSTQHKARILKRGNTQVLMPGSLRKRGEFSILNLSLVPVEEGEKCATARSKTRFHWKVRTVDCHNLNNRVGRGARQLL